MSTNKIIMIPDHKPLHAMANGGYSRKRGPLPQTSLPLSIVKALVNQKNPPLTVLELPDMGKGGKPIRLTPNNVQLPYHINAGGTAPAEQVDAVTTTAPQTVTVEDVVTTSAEAVVEQPPVQPVVEETVVEPVVEPVVEETVVTEAVTEETAPAEQVDAVTTTEEGVEVTEDAEVSTTEDQTAEGDGTTEGDQSNNYQSKKNKKNRNR